MKRVRFLHIAPSHLGQFAHLLDLGLFLVRVLLGLLGQFLKLLGSELLTKEKHVQKINK